MKRMLLLATMMFGGFVLSGCDLIPTEVIDDIQELSEELCREDPTNELCQIDDLSTISETVASQLVIDAFDTLTATNPELCDTVFSITKTALLDACKDGTLLPEGVTSFTILSYEQVGLEYVFEGSVGEDSYLEVRITLGEVDGNTRITSFTTTVIDKPGDAETDLTVEEFETLFKQFIADYLNPAITDETLATDYFENGVDAGFEADREMDQTAGVTITFISAELMEPNVYAVTLEFDENGVKSVETIKVRVNQVDMALYLVFDGEDNDCDGVDECVVDEPVTLEEFEAVFQQFLADYLDPLVTIDTLEMTYFMEPLDPDFREGRQMNLTAGTLITYVSSVPLEYNVFEVTVEIGEGEMKETDTIKVKVNRIEMALYLHFDGEDNDCDGVDECMYGDPVTMDEFEPFFQQFIADYLDPDVDNDTIQYTYFWYTLDPEFFLERDETIQAGTMITYVSGTFLGENKFEVILDFDTNGVLRTETVEVRVNRIDMALYLDFDSKDDDCDGVEDCYFDPVTLEEFESLFTMFISDYFNPDVSDADFAMMYFYFPPQVDFFEQRAMDIQSMLQITYLSSVMVDYNLFEVQLEMVEDGVAVTETIKVRVNRIDMALYLNFDDIDDDCDGIDYCYPDDLVTGQAAIDFLQTYFLDYVNPDITNEVFANLYLDGYMSDRFLEERTQDLLDGAQFEIINVFFYDDGSFELEYSRQVGNDKVVLKRPGRIRQRPDVLVAEWDEHIDHQIELDLVVVTDIFNGFIADYLNPEKTDLEFVQKYFGFDGMLWFTANRQADLVNGLQITVNSVMAYDDYGLFEANFTLVQGDVTATRYMRFVVGRIDQTTPVLYIVDTGGEDNDCDLIGDFCEVVMDPVMAQSYMEQFLVLFNDPTVTDDALKVYLLGPSMMLEFRAQDLAEGLIWTLEESVEPMEEDYFLFRLVATGTDYIVHRDIAARVYYRQSLAIFREYEMKDGCVLSVDVCHFMTDPGVETELDIIVPFLQDLFLQLNDPTVSDDMIQESFGWMAPEAILNARNNPDGGAVFVFERVLAPTDVTLDSFFDVEYTITLPNQEPMHYRFQAQFRRTEIGLMMEVLYPVDMPQ